MEQTGELGARARLAITFLNFVPGIFEDGGRSQWAQWLGGNKDEGQAADSSGSKAATIETPGGTVAGTSTGSESRRDDPQRDGVNAWFAAGAEHVLQGLKLMDPLDSEVINLHNGTYWLDQPVADPNNPGQLSAASAVQA